MVHGRTQNPTPGAFEWRERDLNVQLLQFVGEKRLLRLDANCLNLGLSTPAAALLTKWIGIRAQSLIGVGRLTCPASTPRLVLIVVDRRRRRLRLAPPRLASGA
jgi:hypothetical protein